MFNAILIILAFIIFLSMLSFGFAVAVTTHKILTKQFKKYLKFGGNKC